MLYNCETEINKAINSIIFAKRLLIETIISSASCVVVEYENISCCVKNRMGYKNIRACKDYTFEYVKLSEIKGIISDLQKKFYGRKIWLLLEE